MSKFHKWQNRLQRAPDDGGAGGGGEGGEGEGGEEGKGEEDPKASGLLDDADKNDPPKGKGEGEGDEDPKGGEGEDDGPYKPEGLEDHLQGESDKDTIDKLLNRNKGLRQELSKKGESKAPEKAEDYKIEAPDDFGIELSSEGDQKALDIVKKIAHERGISQDDFSALVLGVVKASHEEGIGEPKFDAEAEYEKLGGDKGAEAGKQFTTAILGWGRALQAQGHLSESEYDEFKIMGGTAEGIRVLSKIRGLTGEKPIPLEGSSPDGDMSDNELYAMMDDPKYQTDPAFREEVEAKFQKRFGTAAAGSSIPRA